MESEREERKRSIRAARDWLAGAEDALAGADDVSGDLKLMLARAELACTTSTRRARLRHTGARTYRRACHRNRGAGRNAGGAGTC